MAYDTATSASVLCTLVFQWTMISLEIGTRGYVAVGSRRFASEAETLLRF